jgi:hypothetical protein
MKASRFPTSFSTVYFLLILCGIGLTKSGLMINTIYTITRIYTTTLYIALYNKENTTSIKERTNIDRVNIARICTSAQLRSITSERRNRPFS